MENSNVRNYIEAIRMMLSNQNVYAASATNHMALAKGLIDLSTFQAAARIIAEAFLNA